MKTFDNSHDSLAAAAKEILEGNTSNKESLLERDTALVDMIKYSGAVGLFSKKVAKVITDDDEAALFPTGMVTRDGVAMQRILLNYIADKMGTDPKRKFGPYFDRVDLVGPGREGKTALRGALDPRKKFKIKDLIKALETFKEEVTESEEVTISVDFGSLTEKVRPGKGKTTVDVDYMGDSYFTNVSQRKFKIKIKPTGKSTADITGEKKDIIAFLQSDDYGMDDRDIKDLFPELLESLTEAKIEVPTDEKDVKAFLDKAKMMRATEKDFDQSMKPLDLKQFAMFDKIARDHKDFVRAYQTGYDAGMGYDLPYPGGLKGNNPHKKNTYAYWLWMDIAGQGMSDA